MLKTISFFLLFLASLPLQAIDVPPVLTDTVPKSKVETNYEKALKDTEELKKKLQEAQTNNEQLQRDNVSLKQENNALKQNLQIQLDVMAGSLKALEKRTANTPTNESFDILVTSFYERLRSTDDSVSFWGIVSGLIAVLITIILASLALFHFGRIKEVERKAKTALAQSQRETRMAIDEAIRRSEKSAQTTATDVTENWIKEHGGKDIKNLEAQIQKQLLDLEKSNRLLKERERFAINVTNEIKQKQNEVTLLEIPTSENGNINNTNINEILKIIPSQRTHSQYISILNHYRKKKKYSWCINFARKHCPKEMYPDFFNLTVTLFEILSLQALHRFSEASSVIEKKLKGKSPEDIFEMPQGPLYLIAIANNNMALERYEQVNDHISILLNSVDKSSISPENLLSMLKLSINWSMESNSPAHEATYELAQHILKNSEVGGKNWSEASIITMLLKAHNNEEFSEYFKSIVNQVNNTEYYISFYTAFTHCLLLKGNWEEILVRYKEVQHSNIIKTKDIEFSNTLLTMNYAYALMKLGSRRKAYLLGLLVENYFIVNETPPLNKAKKELETILGRAYGCSKS